MRQTPQPGALLGDALQQAGEIGGGVHWSHGAFIPSRGSPSFGPLYVTRTLAVGVDTGSAPPGAFA
ncbi:MAG: hypothetical protein AB7Q29_02950 [Vicinamibacterales bacterium]